MAKNYTILSGIFFQDANFTISIFHPSLVDGMWRLLGKYRSHTNLVNDISFISSIQHPRLFSVGNDRKLVEYSISITRLVYAIQHNSIIGL